MTLQLNRNNIERLIINDQDIDSAYLNRSRFFYRPPVTISRSIAGIAENERKYANAKSFYVPSSGSDGFWIYSCQSWLTFVSGGDQYFYQRNGGYGVNIYPTVKLSGFNSVAGPARNNSSHTYNYNKGAVGVVVKNSSPKDVFILGETLAIASDTGINIAAAAREYGLTIDEGDLVLIFAQSNGRTQNNSPIAGFLSLQILKYDSADGHWMSNNGVQYDLCAVYYHQVKSSGSLNQTISARSYFRGTFDKFVRLKVILVKKA